MKRAIPVALLLPILMGMGGCFLRFRSEPGKSLETVTLGVYEGDASMLVYYGADKGLFEKYGLDVKLESYNAGKLAEEAMIRGDVDICTCSDFVFLKDSEAQRDLRILGSINTNRIIWLLARKDHGISAPEDLAGKKIGYTLGSSSEFYLGRFLDANGLSYGDVESIDLTPPEIGDQLAAGAIDAAVTWYPDVYWINQKMENLLQNYEVQVGLDAFFLLCGTDGWVRDHPGELEALFRGMYEAERRIDAGSEDSIAYLGERFGLPPDLARTIWSLHVMELTLPQSLLVTLDAKKRWFFHDREDLELNFLDYITPEPLEKAKPEGVSYIR